MQNIIIGITVHQSDDGEKFAVKQSYVNAVKAIGAVPVLLPFSDDVCALVSRLDALIISGGEDVAPARYGQEPDGSHQPDLQRDEFEIAIAREMIQQKKPVLGICRGAQILNVLGGGSLYQDIAKDLKINHPINQNHKIITVEGTEIAKVLGQQTTVNSRHHQACGKLAPGAVVSARSEEGIVEAFEVPGKRIYGVQFHPEDLIGENERIKGLFELLIKSEG